MIKLSTIFTCILLHLWTALGQESQWTLEKEKNGISVYTRSHINSDFKEFRAEMAVNAEPESIIALIKNADHFTKWMHNCKSSELLKRVSSKEQYNYTETTLPFPFENRDMIFRVHFKQEGDTHIVSIEGVPGYIKEKKGITRMKAAKGYWKIIPEADDKVFVQYQFWVEPGGAIPSWLANLKVVEIPYETFVKMKYQLNE